MYRDRKQQQNTAFTAIPYEGISTDQELLWAALVRVGSLHTAETMLNISEHLMNISAHCILVSSAIASARKLLTSETLQNPSRKQSDSLCSMCRYHRLCWSRKTTHQ